MSPANDEMFLSVVAAAFNEEDNLHQLLQEIDAAIAPMGKPWEVVIANDGSTDRTGAILEELMGQYPTLRVLRFAEGRVGQTAALDAVYRNARGRIIATLDADLQNDPADIPGMVALIENNECDMVNGWRTNRRDPWLRLVSTRIANGVRNWLTRENIHDSACGLKVFRAECIARIRFFNGLHRFVPTLVKMEGYRVKEIPVNHRPRVAGQAKYGVWNRVFKALRDTFAIRWMQSRRFQYTAQEVPGQKKT